MLVNGILTKKQLKDRHILAIMTVPSYFQPNTIYCGDCKDVLKRFPENSIDVIYADPPFFSNKHYEVIWGDGYEIRAFEDRWKGGINHYIGWMQERLFDCYRVLKENGTMFLHCDYHAGHYLKVAMDDLFGYKHFINELVWCYETSGKGKKQFSRKHDTIFWYAKGKKWTFNAKDVSIPRKRNKHMRMGVDENGREYEEKTDAKTKKVYRWYFDEGRLPFDYWTDIQFINREAKERMGYPTQKPEALLERIIKASSNAMDIILDPFCGCGTAIVMSHKLGRRWIGIDVSPTACDLMARRMRLLNFTPKLVGMPLTEDDLRNVNPFEFQNWVCRRLFGRVSARKTADMGIDGYTFEGYPIQVKQSDNVGRNVVDNFETALRRKKKTKGVIVGFSFTKGTYEEIARVKLHGGLEIQALTVKELIANSNRLGKTKLQQKFL